MMHSNSSISFIFNHTKIEGHLPLSQLIATYKGKAIDAKENDHKYSFVTKFLSQKNIDTIKDTQTLVFKGNYIWLKAAPDRQGEEATWIKINKHELINKLGIKEGELDSIKTSKELQELMSKKVYEALNKHDDDKLVGVDKLITTLIKSILCFFVVGPTAKNMIRVQISNIDKKEAVSKGLEEIYVSRSKELLESVKNNLKKENPKALLYFGDEKISEIIDELLIEEANKKLRQDKKPEWNENKMKDLNILRDLDAFIGNPNGIIEYEKLKGMKANDVPIAKIAEIPITDQNKLKLEEIFTDVIVELYKEGKLDKLETGKDPRALLLQLDYAIKFLEVFYFFPPNLFIPKDSVLRKYHRDDGEKIVNFTIQNRASMGKVTSSTALSMENLRDSMRIYDRKIRPQILDCIKHYEINNAVPNLINLYLDIYVDTYTIKHVGKNYIASAFWNQLGGSEREFFTVDDIHDLLCREIERTLVVHYHLTSTQLSNIRDYRKKISEEIDRFKVFNEKLRHCKTPEEIEELLHEKKNQAVDLNFRQGDEISVLDQLKLKNSLEMRKNALYKISKIETNTKQTKKTNLSIKMKINQEINQLWFYKKQMEESVSRLESENGAQRRTPLEIRQLLINTKVMEEVDAGQNSPLFTPQQLKGLLNFDFYFNDLKSRTSLWQVPDKVKMSEDEIAKNAQFLEDLRKDPQLIKVLESFKQKQPNNAIQIVLNKVPSFLHGLIKKMFSVKEETGIVNKIPAGLSQNTIDFLLQYVKKIEKMEKMEIELGLTVKKADELLKKFHDGQSITKQEKLTLKELGLIEFSLIVGDGRFSNNPNNPMFSFMSELKSLGFEKANHTLISFGEHREKAQNIWDTLKDILPNEIGAHYQAGDILASNLKSQEMWKGRPLAIYQRLLSFFTSGVEHGAKLYKYAENRIAVSEINYKKETNSLHLTNLLQSDIWRLNLAPLVPPFLEKNLKEVYGDDWENKIQQLYSDIENGIHLNHEKLSKLKNESERMELAGLANYPILATLFKGKKVKGHERDYEKDLRKIHKDFILNKDTPIEGKKEIENPKMICSEFVSKVTIAALIELNNQISQKLLLHYGKDFSNRHILKNNRDDLKKQGYKISRNVSDYVNGVRHFGQDAEITKKAEKKWRAVLKKLGYSAEDIEFTIRIGNKDILDLPYSKKERIKAIHPGRMVQLLVERGCAVKMKLPPKLDLLFDVEVPEKK